ncbi:MAG: putative 2-aminoethylphosphonate ABC transporter substrate-binding protein [Cyanobacteria bacterium]|jgi:iron(III) transport system substrate-binding protein|nr:putative 2-aminoethylphosphonate ABC transporter substrate-binding protein [Cyanobacteria bacterium GSL.Bin21]
MTKQYSFRVGLISILSVTLAMAVSGCVTKQNPSNSTAESGTANSSTLTVYTALEDDQIGGYLESFQEQYPDININIVRDSTGIITAKLIAEKNNPQADVIWGLAASSLLLADQEGMLEPYAPSNLEDVQPKFRDDLNPPRWVGIDAWMSAFCVNTIELEENNLPMPQSWADLTKPEYKGQIVMPNPASSGTGYLSVAAILQMKGEEQGWQYLDSLHENIAQYMHSGSKPCKVAGAGEYPIGISFGYRAVRQMEGGEPIKPVFPEEGSGWDVEANALVKKPQIKPAAKDFLDWAITQEVSEQYAENFAITAVKTNTPNPKGYPEEPSEQLINNDFSWMAENRERILAEWTSRYGAKSEPEEN